MTKEEEIIGKRFADLIDLRNNIHYLINIDGRENIYHYYQNEKTVNIIIKEYDEKVLASQAIMQRAAIYKSAKHFML